MKKYDMTSEVSPSDDVKNAALIILNAALSKSVEKSDEKSDDDVMGKVTEFMLNSSFNQAQEIETLMNEVRPFIVRALKEVRAEINDKKRLANHNSAVRTEALD